MGNQNICSNDSYGKIMIMTQKKKYVAGEQVNGHINLSLSQAFPSTDLFLVIEGKEKTKVVDSRTYTGEYFILGFGEQERVWRLKQCV